jgi:hypothetical protein
MPSVVNWFLELHLFLCRVVDWKFIFKKLSVSSQNKELDGQVLSFFCEYKLRHDCYDF